MCVKDGSETVCLCLCRMDGRALREGQTDEKLRAQGGREKGLFDMGEGGEGGDEDECRANENDGAVREKDCEYAAKELVKWAVIRIVCGAALRFFNAN